MNRWIRLSKIRVLELWKCVKQFYKKKNTLNVHLFYYFILNTLRLVCKKIHTKYLIKIGYKLCNLGSIFMTYVLHTLIVKSGMNFLIYFIYPYAVCSMLYFDYHQHTFEKICKIPSIYEYIDILILFY